MNRRDFLRLKARGKERVAELSCERLYMRYLDARMSDTRWDGGRPPSAADEWLPWSGEPPTSIREPTSQELLEDLQRNLSDADVLHVLDSHWLMNPEFRRDMETLLESIRVRGVRVEFGCPNNVS